MRQTQETQCIRETHFHFGAINSFINILTNPIRSLATLCISASSLPSPDSNHFGAYIKLSNKKSITGNSFNILYFSRLPSHSYVPYAISPVNYSVSFPSPSLVFAYPIQGHSWSYYYLANTAAFHQVQRNGILLERAVQLSNRYLWINETNGF